MYDYSYLLYIIYIIYLKKKKVVQYYNIYYITLYNYNIIYRTTNINVTWQLDIIHDDWIKTVSFSSFISSNVNKILAHFIAVMLAIKLSLMD